VPGYLQRPFPDRIDRVVDHFLGGYRLADDATRAAVRTAIHLDHAQTLGAYGERMATLAVRERSVDLLARGLLAAMLRGNCPQEDLRDVLVSIAPLQRSAERLGVDPEDEFERAAALPAPTHREHCATFPAASPEIADLPPSTSLSAMTMAACCTSRSGTWSSSGCRRTFEKRSISSRPWTPSATCASR